MKFLGKRSDRLRIPKQLGTDPVLGAIIRRGADADGRDIEMQILFLIEMGLEHEGICLRHARRREELHTAAQATHDFGDSERGERPHGAAPHSTPLHAAAQEKTA